jgi:AraC-like DNA-binding protein
MISFDQLVDGLQIRLTPFTVCEVRSGAGLPLGPAPRPSIHYVLRGRAQGRRRGKPDAELPSHSVLILPAHLEMTFVCPDEATVAFPEPRCQPIPGGWKWIEVGDGEPGAVLACGELEATHQGAVGLFDYLHEPIIQEMGGEPPFRDAIELLLNELAYPKPGTPVLAASLMKQCLIVLLRRYWHDDERQAPWLSALKQPQLGKAIAAMAKEPRSSFTLETLAGIAGMSRAAFAEHFKKAFGRPAIEYLKEVRLRRAAELLAMTDLPIKVVAARVGFTSRSYFTRAFRAFSGVHPTEYRSSAKGR